MAWDYKRHGIYSEIFDMETLERDVKKLSISI